MSTFSHNFRIYNAERFIDSVSSVPVYLSIGNPRSWTDDANPPVANTSIIACDEVWRYMIGLKKITGNDVRFVVPRLNWQSGRIYEVYDDTISSETLYSLVFPFYVVTDEWNVYKCLSNNNRGESTVKPTSTLTSGSVETADKYIWKYMYTISAEERLRFTTESYIPVRTLTENNGSLQWQVQDSAVDGAIEAVFVTNPGEGYVDANTITITISGDGTGANAIARINTTTNVITSVIMTNPGSGYSYANVTISDSSGGANGAARAVISPPGGHGSDPLHELGGGFVIINARVRDTEAGKLSVDNEFRQVAIIAEPRLRDGSTLATNTVYSQTTTLALDSGATSFEEDEYVYQGTSLSTATFRGTVLAWDNANSIIKLIDVVGTPQATVLNGETSRAARLVQSVTEKELTPFSGHLLYINNIQPIQRASDQTEDFKIVIQF